MLEEAARGGGDREGCNKGEATQLAAADGPGVWTAASGPPDSLLDW